MGRRRAQKLRFDGVNDLLKEGIIPQGSPDALEAIARQTADLTGDHYKDARADADSPYALVIPSTPSFANSEYAPAAIAEQQAERDRVTNAAAAERARKLAEVDRVFAERDAHAGWAFQMFWRTFDPRVHPQPAFEYLRTYAFDRGLTATNPTTSFLSPTDGPGLEKAQAELHLPELHQKYDPSGATWQMRASIIREAQARK